MFWRLFLLPLLFILLTYARHLVDETDQRFALSFHLWKFNSQHLSTLVCVSLLHMQIVFKYSE